MEQPQRKILIVEDSRMVGELLSTQIQHQLGWSVEHAVSYAEAEIKAGDGPYAAAVVDINLPDAEPGKALDSMLHRGIPTIAFTADLSDPLREDLWSRGIVDYVLKEGKHSLAYIASLLGRLERNPAIAVLVVDDSATARAYLRRLLEIHKYRVIEAEGGEEALAALHADPGIRLVLLDFVMPGMGGDALAREIRVRFPTRGLSVIGVSAQGNSRMSARILKSGANDFLSKPFTAEELYCRVSQNLELIERFETIELMAVTDPLTGLYNRRYFMEAGRQRHAECLRHNTSLALAEADADLFKRVNDFHGHAAGDAVLKGIASALKARFRTSDVVARLGGEEFAVLLPGISAENARRVIEDVRVRIERTHATFGGKDIPATVSFGLTMKPGDNFEEMLHEADRNLYRAKEAGRNRVVGDET